MHRREQTVSRTQQSKRCTKHHCQLMNPALGILTTKALTGEQRTFCVLDYDKCQSVDDRNGDFVRHTEQKHLQIGQFVVVSIMKCWNVCGRNLNTELMFFYVTRGDHMEQL